MFNGNGYDADEQATLTGKGCWRIDNGVDAICRLSAHKNLQLFADMRVLAPHECLAREAVMLQQYTGVVEMEVSCMTLKFVRSC